ncbi:hypothetical protein TNCV_4209961, partial [Trichonephila clavipes]
MANSRMTFCESLWLQRMPPHIQTVLLHPQSLWINWLSSLIKFLRLLVRPRLSVRPQKLFLHHPSHLHAVLSQSMDSSARQLQELSLQVAELTRERNSFLATNVIVRTAGDHIHALGVSIEEATSATIIAVIKSRARKCVPPCAFVQKNEPQVWPEISHRLLEVKSVSSPTLPTMNKSPQSNFSLFAANNTKFQPMMQTLVLKNILSEYPDLSNPSLISKSASHGTVHHIITTGPPVTARPRRATPKLNDAVK